MAKGSSNERKKAREWSLWFSEGESDNWFWRVDSGARATTRAKKGLHTPNAYGDLMAIDPKGESLIRIVTIELKKGYNKVLDLLSIVDSKPGVKNTFLTFWDQAVSSANDAAKAGWGKIPLLEINRDRKQPVLAMHKSLFNELCSFAGEPKNEKALANELTQFAITIDSFGLQLILIPRKVFFNWISPEFFKLSRQIGESYLAVPIANPKKGEK